MLPFNSWGEQNGSSAKSEGRQFAESTHIPPLMEINSSMLRVKTELLPPRPDDPAVQLVNAWISSALNDANTNDGAAFRRQRRFLEAHPALLTPQSDSVLYEMMALASGDAGTVWITQRHLRVLHQARAGGGTIEAIRRAYVNVYGGLSLDVPAWLELAMQQYTQLQQGQTYQTATASRILLHECLARLESDLTIPEEVGADLYGLLGMALRADETISRRRRYEDAIAAYEKALQTYTYDRYPEQFAIVQFNLANAYANRVEGNQQENLEQALLCYEKALRVHMREQFPDEWANIQSKLGTVYSIRERGGKTENRERAIQYYQAALQELGADTRADVWAETQLNLGILYLEQAERGSTKILERAIQCFNAALRYYTRETRSDGWAMSQNYLGLAYLRRTEGDLATNIERAIYCLQSSLRVVTREALPFDWIETQKGLGKAYLKRLTGTPSENIELAIQHLTAALDAIDPALTRIKWLKTLNDLGEAYRRRVLGNRAENLRQARRYHQQVLMTTPPDLAQYQRAQLALAYLSASRYAG